MDRPEEEGHSININSLINNNKESELNELSEIIAEYDRRLQEQVTLARQDVLVELEKNIQVSGVYLFLLLCEWESVWCFL